MARRTDAAAASRWREAVWALLLSAVLSAGVVGVLLLNTSMQQQSIRLTHEQQQVQLLSARSQDVAASLARSANPVLLAARARQLHMHPATRTRWARTATSH